MKTIFVMTRKEVYTCMNIYEWISNYICHDKKRSLYMHEYLRMDFHGCFSEQLRGEERCIWGLRTM